MNNEQKLLEVFNKLDVNVPEGYFYSERRLREYIVQRIVSEKHIQPI